MAQPDNSGDIAPEAGARPPRDVSIPALITNPQTVRAAFIVALIVGTILNLINQGDALLNGDEIIFWKLILTYMVPYCVSTYGAVMALRSQPRS